MIADAVVDDQRFVKSFGEESQRGQRERAGAAGRIADFEVQDFFGLLGRPLFGGGIEIGLTVVAGGRIVGQRTQRAVHRRDGQLRSRVERAGAFSRAAPSHQIPFAGQDDLDHKLAGLAVKRLLVLHLPLGRHARRGALRTRLPTSQARRAQASAAT